MIMSIDLLIPPYTSLNSSQVCRIQIAVMKQSWSNSKLKEFKQHVPGWISVTGRSYIHIYIHIYIHYLLFCVDNRRINSLWKECNGSIFVQSYNIWNNSGNIKGWKRKSILQRVYMQNKNTQKKKRAKLSCSFAFVDVVERVNVGCEITKRNVWRISR